MPETAVNQNLVPKREKLGKISNKLNLDTDSWGWDVHSLAIDQGLTYPSIPKISYIDNFPNSHLILLSLYLLLYLTIKVHIKFLPVPASTSTTLF
jgi:hypothetical protein